MPNPNGLPLYVFANGDEKGPTIHGDFLNGWDSEKLTKVIAQCSALGHGNTNLCPVLKVSNVQAETCTLEGEVPDEDVGLTDKITVLPGCNALGGGPIPGCTAATSFIQPKTLAHLHQHEGLPLVTPTTFTSTLPSYLPFVASFRYQGCIVDTTPRVLNNTFISDAKLTPDQCALECVNFKYFGMENGLFYLLTTNDVH